MDLISHIGGGALIAGALPPQRAGPAATLAVTVAAALPDLDMVWVRLSDDPMAFATIHRGFTHSLLGIAVMAPLVALLFRRFSKDKNYPRLVALVALGLLWHVAGDVPTYLGTMVFYPFSRERAALDFLHPFDPTRLIIVFLTLLAAWTYSRREGAVSRGPGSRQAWTTFSRIGLAALAAYLGVCAVGQRLALEQVRRFSGAQGLEVRAQTAMPHLDKAPPLHWLGLVLTPQGVYRSWFSLLDKDSPRFEFIPSSAEDGLAMQAQALPEVQTYLWFARFPVRRTREEGARHIIEYSDLCHPQMSDFRVVLGKQGGVLAVGFADGS